MCNPIYGELRQSQVCQPEKDVENDYVLNKAEYPSTVTAVHSPLLNYQPNYNNNRN